MEFRIVHAIEDDVAAIAAMIGEVEEFYGGAARVPEQEQVRAALFGPRPAATVLLARTATGQLVGFAAVCVLWPAAGADTSAYLKELWVRQDYRRRGAARALMAAVHDWARELGCSRVEWTADRGNPGALALYRALGFQQLEGKAVYRSEVTG